MQALASYIMKGRMQAMTIAASFAMLSMLMPPVSVVSSAAVALVTLRRGAKEGGLVLISSCIAAVMLGLLVMGQYQFALVYGLALWLPVWLMAIVLREGRQLFWTVELSVLLGAVGIIGFYFYHSDPASVWLTMLNAMLTQMAVVTPDQTAVEQNRQMLAVLSHFMTGIVVAGMVSGLLLGLVVARWWQAMLYNPGGFLVEYLSLKSNPRLALASLVVLAVALLLSGWVAEMCWNITVLMVLFYAFIGTAVLHAIFATMKRGRFIIPVLYLMLFLIPHIAILVAILGLSDAWLNLRNKLKSTGAKAL